MENPNRNSVLKGIAGFLTASAYIAVILISASAILYAISLATGLDPLSATFLPYAIAIVVGYITIDWLLAISGKPSPALVVLVVVVLIPVSLVIVTIKEIGQLRLLVHDEVKTLIESARKVTPL